MKADSNKFLRDLLAAPSPSGYEQPAQEVFRKRVKSCVDSLKTDLHGNVIATINPNAKLRIMFSGHNDQIGFQIKFIDKDGYLYFGNLGGHDATVVAGQRVVIHSKKGPVEGIIGKKAIHLMSPKERSTVPQLEDMWIDIGAKDKKDAEKAVELGDPVTYAVDYLPLRQDFISCMGLDDKIGSYIVAETLRALAPQKKNLKVAVFGVSSVQEEVGLRGARTSAFGIDPHIGIAVEVSHSSDYPGVNKKIIGDTKLGKGPILCKGCNINPVLDEKMQSVAKKKKIPYQLKVYIGPTGTDANAMQITRAGVATALVKIPNRYMHTPNEVVSLKDLDNGVKLLTEFILSLKGNESFIPM